MSKINNRKKEEQEILKQMEEAMKDDAKDNDSLDKEVEEDKDSKLDYFSGLDNNYHCPNCNHVLNSRHDVCPKCGYRGYVPMKPKETRIIKFILFGILLAIFILYMIFRTA